METQFTLPHRAFAPREAEALDGPLEGQSYLVDLTREIVELVPGLPYRLIEGESGELYYLLATDVIPRQPDWTYLGEHR